MSVDPWHVTRFPPIENKFELGGVTEGEDTGLSVLYKLQQIRVV